MLTVVKIILMLVIVLLLSYPFISAKGKLRRFFVASSLKYNSPHNRKNIFFVFLAFVEFVVVALLFKLFDKFSQFIYSVPVISNLFSKAAISVNSQLDYILFAIKLIIINLVFIYAFVFFKGFLRRAVINPIFHLGNKKKTFKLFRKKDNKKDEESNNDNSQNNENDAEKIRKRRRIPDFTHSFFEDDGVDDEELSGENKKKYGPVASKMLSLFFEGEEFEYAKNWVVRVRTVLQLFVRLVQAVYLLFVVVTLVSLFFSLPTTVYDILLNVIKIKEWYIYPVISLVFLQEICNVFHAMPQGIKSVEEKIQDEERKEDKKRDARIRALLAELKKRFDSEHSLRYYPEVLPESFPEYKCTNIAYSSSMEYIKKFMKQSSGRVVQSYMECIDAAFNDSHVYFSASLYSELGEYLIAYTYIRLLSGARLIFIVSNPDEKETLRRYISDRLMNMTGSHASATWRVFTANERLDQADVLIATPDDFTNSNIVAQNPAFFEEVCNAVFIDADRMISLDGYICPVIATRLQNATKDRVRFIFLSLDLLKGFAARSLPKFFCVDKVLSFSSAGENEAVSFILWNKESKKNRIYNKSGQKLTCLETIIAEQACKYGMDGVRLITESPLEHAERQTLALHNVEINNLYKNVVDVNYMIYSDDRCNLSAALYACTRFRGRKKSIVHILSKPYLLREYFMSKAAAEDYINRSSFIQPRVTEHAERHKLSLVKIFCDASSENGIDISDFERRMKDLLITTKERGDIVSSAFCRNILETGDISQLKINELAAYLIAGLCDNNSKESDELEIANIVNSVGNRAKDFYLIIDPTRQIGIIRNPRKRIIFNRIKEVFEYLLECNKRVELRLNDEVIGLLDTFPNRVHLEYIVGQSIIYKNAEYEIEHIADDGSAIYLRSENIGIKNCLDTVLLRRYDIAQVTPVEESGVLNNSVSKLEEIRVTKCIGVLNAETYGFYSLTTDRQTIDFYRGVEGDPDSDHAIIRKYSDADILKVSLNTRMECNDGMRLLLSAVFNEFIRTIFPKAYHCIAICPILKNPVDQNNNDNIINRIKTLYPYLKNPGEGFVETDDNVMQFLFINDCTEDIGVLDWFYDRGARYMQEFLANVYSYLHWLKLLPNKKHYIYFGGKNLPECYDLDSCCELLSEFNLVLSDDGKKDYETAGEENTEEKLELCSFCHKPMESGRFSFFDKHRFICADCFEIVDDLEQLEELYISTKEYLAKQYPDLSFGAVDVKLDPVYELTSEQLLSQFYYRVDFSERTVYVEIDDPKNNVSVSILRGIIAFWQVDNSAANHYAEAQLYYEEIKYLRSIDENESADWVYNNVPDTIRAQLDEITNYVNFTDKVEYNEDDLLDDEEAKDTEDNNPPVEDHDGEIRNSFLFMIMKSKESSSDEWDGEDPEDNEFSYNLYDPNKVPRFWKRYLRGEHIDDGQDEQLPDLENEEAGEEEPLAVNCCIRPNAPLDDLTNDSNNESENKTDELNDKTDTISDRDRKKEERRLKKEERNRQRQLKWDEKLAEIERQEEERKKRLLGNPDDSKKQKDGWSLFRRKKKDAPIDDKLTDDVSDEISDNIVDDVTEETVDEVTENVVDDVTEDTADEVAEDIVDDATEDTNDEITDDIVDDLIDGVVDETEEVPEDTSDQKEAKKNRKKLRDIFKKKSLGERIVPYEEEEKTNPRIRIYNEIIRAAYNFSSEFISAKDVSWEELNRIFCYAMGDYPEIFWVDRYLPYSDHTFVLTYRCKDANGRLDMKQIESKRAAIQRGAKKFTEGITRRTDPYEAFLTIYRRLILTLDYDSLGIRAQADKDYGRDDALRSLYGAFVENKVVCAGYAYAMQYLLQSVGIVCGYVISEVRGSDCHAFNIVKLGKYCYYLDVTWGDPSNTDKSEYKWDWTNVVNYGYLCTPYSDFIRASKEQEIFHHPNRELYPELEEFKYTNHEFYRYHNAFIKSYDENKMIDVFINSALSYKGLKEMGDFSVSFRCSDTNLADYIAYSLNGNNFAKLNGLIERAKTAVAKKSKKAAKLFERSNSGAVTSYAGVVSIYFATPKGKSKKSK